MKNVFIMKEMYESLTKKDRATLDKLIKKMNHVLMPASTSEYIGNVMEPRHMGWPIAGGDLKLIDKKTSDKINILLVEISEKEELTKLRKMKSYFEKLKEGLN